MKSFEDFRERVLRALESWDQNALEISDLAQSYYTELDENRRLFIAMREIIKEKDNLIGKFQRTLQAKDQYFASTTFELKKETERYTSQIKQDLID